METIACAACGAENNIVRSTCEKCGADLLVIKNILNNANKHYNTGLELAQQGRNEEATVELKAAIELWGKNPNYHNLLGTVYARRGLYDLAIKEWEATLALEPLFEKAHTSIEKARKMELHLQQQVRSFPYRMFAAAVGLVALLAILGLIFLGVRFRSAQRETDQLKARLAAGTSSEDVQQLKVALGLKERQVANLESRLSGAERELQSRQERITELEEQVATLERDPSGVDRQRLEQLTAQVEQLETKGEQLAEQLRLSEDKAARLQSALEQSQSRQAQAQKDLEQLRSLLDRARNDLQVLQAHEDLIAQAYRLWQEEKDKELLFVLEQMEGLAMNAALVADLRGRAQERLRLREDPLYRARQEAEARAAEAKEQEERQYYAGLKVEEGLSRLRQGDWEGARRQFEAALAIDPNHAEAQRQLEEARAKIAEQRRQIDDQLRAAQVALGEGRFDEAMEGFGAVLAAEPDNATAQAGLQAAEESKAEAGQAEARRQQEIAELSRQASRAAEAGRVEEALQRYRQWLQLEPDNRSVQRQIERIERDEQKRLNDMNQLYASGRLYYERRDYERSIRDFEQALLMARLPEEKERIQSALDVVRRAYEEFRRAEQERAEAIAAGYQEASNLYEDGLLEPALEEVGKVLALDPNHREARRLKRSIESALARQ